MYRQFMPKFRLAIPVMLGTLMTVGSSEVSAAPTSEELIKEGVELRRDGRDADALAKFSAAYALGKPPRAAAQWGLCLQAVARWSEAEPLLAEAVSARQDPWIKKNRDTLKDSLEVVKTHIGSIEVLGEPVGASVSIAGRVVGTLPLLAAVIVNEGTVDVEVSAKGFKRAFRTLTVTGASYQRVVLRLEEAASVVATAVPAASSIPNPQNIQPTPTIATTTATPEEGRPIIKSPWFWGAIGVVLVGSIVVVALSSGGTNYPPVDGSRKVN